MKVKSRLPICVISALLTVGTSFADESAVRQDARAVEVLKSMSAYTDSLDQVVMTGVSLIDARFGAGLMVSNSQEVTITMDRPGSLHISSFDGVAATDIFIHQEMLTIFNSENNYYAQASIPAEVDAALDFALEELGVEAPLMDLIRSDTKSSLIGPQHSVIYLTDKARVDGVDCHHIAIRGPETDVQLWIQEGDKPVPRRFVLTSKWEGGSPRHSAHMNWQTETELDPGIFEFKAPEGSMNIGFSQRDAHEGEQ